MTLIIAISLLVGLACFVLAYSMTLSEEEAQRELDEHVKRMLKEGE